MSAGDFVHRHIGPGADDVRDMLRRLGLSSLDDLIERTVPESIRDLKPLALPPARTESEVLSFLSHLASRNQLKKSFIGLGYSAAITPPVILRNILENPGWYTAYTPYQAEISQGRMGALLNFQTMVIDLTGMEIANASLLDEATAAAEAVSFCRSLAGRQAEGRGVWVSTECHPQTIDVIQTRSQPLGVSVDTGHPEQLDSTEDYFAILLQYPATDGSLSNMEALVQRAHRDQTLVISATDLLSLCLLKPPGEFGADVVIGNSQRFGVPLAFGGPHAAFFATREKFQRRVPGRIVGVTRDRHHRFALRLALQTREQHIRREKATSNICTAQVLLAVMASMYAVYHGPQGLQAIASRVHHLACDLAGGLLQRGHGLVSRQFFDTIAVRVEAARLARLLQEAAAAGYNLRAIDEETVGISLDETASPGDVEALLEVFSQGNSPGAENDSGRVGIPSSLKRSSPYLTHPVFNRYRSETEMLRYLHRLQARDLSLTHSMIPLGSCTMKLNATAEMLPISQPGFAQVHPFVPLEQVPGYLQLIQELEEMLGVVTGFSAVSVQPNAGSQGEYAGLLVIRRYHQERGEGQRDVCLIPSSAHGTNPASAAMAGLRVVVVACDREGNIDLADLEGKAREHSDRLAALMVTYPSTHGVFEEEIREVCDIVHRHGGQVYLDGANLNALLGVCRPAEFGPDLAHLNLHKTFCIPHGGGGPGVGPIGVREHLAPYLPGHVLRPEAGPGSGISAVSAAPWGSAGILPISWAYIALMGAEGLKRATQIAILNANYIASRLQDHYAVLFVGKNGLVAHECIIDLRPFKKSAGVDVDDVAKRLMDYGFHAPTMSFPVPGTLMIEPTESESKEELDRFCEAMIQIREEIRDVEEGLSDRERNPLKNAPHTAESLISDDWDEPYARETAAYPLPWVRERKFWPAVGRVDNAYGDRNLVCACPPLESYLNDMTRGTWNVERGT